MDYTTEIITRHPPIFCDWVDVTFPADSPLMDLAGDFLSDQRCSAKRVADHTLEYRHPNSAWGNFQLHQSSRGWSRLSASGGSCDALRATGAFGEYLALIGDHPHTLTRLDATMDVSVDAPPIIAALVRKYPPDSLVYHTRKGVRPDYNLQPTLDGGITGTFYAGPLRYGKSKVSSRTYDKRAEIISRTGDDPGPRTRFEITVRKGVGATLRDAFDPVPVFWHFASPALLPAPPGVIAWVPGDSETWAPGSLPVDPYQRLRRRVDESVDIENLIRLADLLRGDGRRELLRLLRGRLGLRDVAVA